jgi:hypothetical protein
MALDQIAVTQLQESPGAQRVIALLDVALLVAGLVRFLVFVSLEVPLLGVIQVMRLVILAFAHALLVPFVLRVIRLLRLVLGKWSSYSLKRASTDTNTQRYRRDRDIAF